MCIRSPTCLRSDASVEWPLQAFMMFGGICCKYYAKKIDAGRMRESSVERHTVPCLSKDRENRRANE